MQYVAYNPTISASRVWVCGFAEVFSVKAGRKFGKVCGKNKRATGRMLAWMTCPGPSEVTGRRRKRRVI